MNGMLGDDPPVLADYDAIRIGVDLHRTPDRTGCHRVFIVIILHRRLLAIVRDDDVCQRLMTVPGVPAPWWR